MCGFQDYFDSNSLLGLLEKELWKLSQHWCNYGPNENMLAYIRYVCQCGSTHYNARL